MLLISINLVFYKFRDYCSAKSQEIELVALIFANINNYSTLETCIPSPSLEGDRCKTRRRQVIAIRTEIILNFPS